MITAAIVSLYLQMGKGWDSDKPRDFAYLMLVTVAITTVVWVTVTLLTPAEPMETLAAFYKRVRPEGPGWKRVSSVTGYAGSHADGTLATQFLNWFLGCALIYGSLFG